MRAWLLTLSLAAVLPAHAAVDVVFVDGRAIRADDFEIDSAALKLEFVGGGSFIVPLANVARILPAELVTGPEGDAIREDVDAAVTGASEVLRTEVELRSREAWRTAAGPYADLLAEAADRHGIGRPLLAALAQVESAFDPKAVSPKGAQGLLQLMPATAARFGVADPFDAAQNVEGGARYLRWLIDRYDGRLDLALAGYNAGEGAVDRYAAVPPYRETLGYVLKVLRRTVQGTASSH